MSLIDEFMSECCFMEETKQADGAGGFDSVWREGATFKAAIVLDSTMEARIAEHQGVTSVYSVVAPRSVPLNYDTKIKRLKDGRYFRITSESQEAPASSSINVVKASAERWELT